MTVQSSFSIDKVLGYPGLIADTMPSNVSDSKLAAAATGFGLAVCRRASPADPVSSAAPPNATADVSARLQGIALRDETRKNTTGYETNDPMRVLRRGRVWVNVEGSVTADAQAFVRFASGAGGTVLGSFRADADTATAVAAPGCYFRTSGTGLQLVEINLP
jgi:hypothetical protein